MNAPHAQPGSAHLFTYGSLMIPEVMVAVTGSRFPCAEAILRGYARYRIEGATYPGLVPERPGQTSGVVYFDVDCRALARLDAFEGEGYRRTRVEVGTADRPCLPAETYLVAPALRHRIVRKAWDLQVFRERHLAQFLDRYEGFSRISTDRDAPSQP